MIFHENCLLADNSPEKIIPYFFRKLGKMSENLSSAAVAIWGLRVNAVGLLVHFTRYFKNIKTRSIRDYFNCM